MKTKRYRSRTDSVLSGVCGGLGQYLGIDSTLVRLFFVLLALAGVGTGLLIYLAMWILVPLEGQDASLPLEQRMRTGANEIGQRAQAFGNSLQRNTGAAGGQPAILAGAVLLLIGTMFLVQNLFGWWLPWLSFGTLWPLLLVLAGAVLLMRRAKEA